MRQATCPWARREPILPRPTLRVWHLLATVRVHLVKIDGGKLSILHLDAAPTRTVSTLSPREVVIG
jgi:hypothetical protein